MRAAATVAALLTAVATLAAALLAATAPAASAQPAAPALSLVLSDISPRLVTTDGPATIGITGTLRNTGPVTVTGLAIRVQRGEALETEGDVRDALDGDAATDAVTPQFAPLADTLAPGGQLPVQLTVPLRGPSTSSLALTTTGTYELLVNVNAAPDGGARARLAAVRMLLPVLGLPPGGGFRAGAAANPVAVASPFTLLYPIADVPVRVSTLPGAPVLLSDDGLASSLAPDGRLGGLVTALAQQAPAGSVLRAATCLAVDPDLVETASLMSQSAGYLVAAPNGSTTKGTGSVAAGQWLTQLRSVARGTCVIALPYADADLVALTRGGLAGTAAAALTTGRQVLASVLQTAVTPVAWPADGLLDDATADVVAGAGSDAAVLSADGVTVARSLLGAIATNALVPLAVGATTSGTSVALPAVLSDPLFARAAVGATEEPADTAPGRGAAVEADTPAGTDTSLSTQDMIGTLAFRAGTGRAVVVAPPHRLATNGDGASALLAAAAQLLDAGLLTSRGLPAVLAGPAAVNTAPLAYPSSAGPAEVPPAAITTIAVAAADVADLRSAVVPGSVVGVSADDLLDPLELGLLRPASATRRGNALAAQDAADAARSTIVGIRGSIHVLEPSSPYSLGTSDAPLPLTVANGLPVTVQVQVQVASTSGLRMAPIATQEIPPLGRRQVSVTAQVTRAGQFVVDASVRTPHGGLLGPPSRLHVRSTAYGTITGWLTAIAGLVLVLLVLRRIRRRARGGDPPPTARVDPGAPRATTRPPSPSRHTAAPPTPSPPSRHDGTPTEAPTERLPVTRGAGGRDPANRVTDRLPVPHDLA